MTHLSVTVLGQALHLDCADTDQRRLADLAEALERRMTKFAPDEPAFQRLAVTALALLDETQATAAALARARCEIERLTDLVVEAKLNAAPMTPDAADRGRVGALRRVADGVA